MQDIDLCVLAAQALELREACELARSKPSTSTGAQVGPLRVLTKDSPVQVNRLGRGMSS